MLARTFSVDSEFMRPALPVSRESGANIHVIVATFHFDIFVLACFNVHVRRGCINVFDLTAIFHGLQMNSAVNNVTL